MVGAEVVPGQLLGEDQPPAHAAPARAVVARCLGELAAAVPGRLHRADEGRAYLVILELAYGGGGGAARRGDPLAQHRGMLTGLPQQLGRAEHGLHHQLGGGVPGQAEVDAGLDHRLDDEEQVRGARAGDRGHRVLVALRHGDHPAGRGQDLGHPVEMLLLAVRARRDGRHALVDLGGGVGHHPDHGDPVGQRASMEAVSTPAASETTKVAGCRHSADLGPAGRACPAA